VTGTIDPRTGFLKVIIHYRGTTQTGYGAILENASYGAGYVLTGTNGEAIQLEP
jgi:hypothetical protein